VCGRYSLECGRKEMGEEVGGQYSNPLLQALYPLVPQYQAESVMVYRSVKINYEQLRQHSYISFLTSTKPAMMPPSFSVLNCT
jgi:hypothetical protein